MTGFHEVRLANSFGGSPETWLKPQLQCDLAQALKNQASLKVRRATRPGGLGEPASPAEISERDINLHPSATLHPRRRAGRGGRW